MSTYITNASFPDTLGPEGGLPVEVLGPVTVTREATDLAETATGAAAQAVVLTLPAVPGQFHFLTHLEITLYTTGVRIGQATPVTVTSANLPGSPAWTFPSAGATGTCATQVMSPAKPLKSATAGTATQILCPVTPNALWRVNVWYEAHP